MSEKIDLKGREKIIKEAKRHIMIAGTQVYSSASGLKPFKVSKLFNVMGKLLQDFDMALTIVLGDYTYNPKSFEFKTHVSMILKAMHEDGLI